MVKKGIFGKCAGAASHCRIPSDPPTETDLKNKSKNMAAKMVTRPDFAGKIISRTRGEEQEDIQAIRASLPPCTLCPLRDGKRPWRGAGW